MLSFAAAAASAAADPTATGPLVPFVAYLPHNAAHDDAAIDTAHERNKFLNRTARNDSDISVATDAAKLRRGDAGHCSHDVQLAWTARLGSSIYSSPIIAVGARGERTVVASTFVRYLERVRGVDGHEERGWPHVFGRSSFHASPLAHDIDGDGVDELLFVSFDAEVVVLRPSGLPLAGASFKLPKLKVKKRWYEQLRDVHTTPYRRASQRRTWHDDEPEAEVEAAAAAGGDAAAAQAAEFGGDVGAHGALSAAAEASFALFADEEGAQYDAEEVAEDLAEAGSEMEEPRLAAWAARFASTAALQAAEAAGYVLVDAHVMTTPLIADVDGDGDDEIVAAVSYFFEEEAVASLARRGVVVDHTKYVAGGVVAASLRTGEVKWSVHLDLTTDETKLRAYIYSSPTAADLDGDGAIEVVVGTSMGFVYVLDGRDGSLRDGFPIQMNEVQAQVVAADVDGDGDLELIVADAIGSVAAWRHDGAALWEVQTSGLCTQSPTIASLKGDGAVQIVVPTVAGVVHVLDGRSGRELPPFPLRTGGRILSAVLVLDLRPAWAALVLAEHAGDTEPHLVFSSFDGHVYIVHATTGCAHKIDVGEHAYAQILADDLTGNGRIDLLLSTMNGNLYCFETSTPFAPLRAWRAAGQGRNGFAQIERTQGIAIGGDAGRHEPRAVSGATFTLEFTIHDARRFGRIVYPRRYAVEARLGRAAPLFAANYTAAGTYTATLRCPTTEGGLPARLRGALTLAMTNEHGQRYTDAIGVAFNEGADRAIAWVVALPVAALVLALAGERRSEQPML